jgi:hypothetical protein
MSDILKQMQREQIELLQQRVKELEASLELRWADIAHLDTKLADVLDRADGCQYSKDVGMWPEHSCVNGCMYDKRLAALQQRVDNLRAERGRLIELLKWARTCVPFPSDCHTAIAAALSAAYKDDSFFLENKERRPFGDKGLQREDQPPPLSPVAAALSAVDQGEWE